MSKGKKIILIVGGSILAVLLALAVVILVNRPDQVIESANYTASYRGEGKDVLTVSLHAKEKAPDGYVWYVETDDPDNVEIKTLGSSKKKVKVKLTPLNTSGTDVRISLKYQKSIQEETALSDAVLEENSEESSGAATEPVSEEIPYEEQLRDALIDVYHTDTIACATVGAILSESTGKAATYNFQLTEPMQPVLLSNELVYPVYAGYDDDNTLILAVASDSMDWLVEISDWSMLTADNPVYESEDAGILQVIPVKALKYTENVQLSVLNYMLNAGVLLDIQVPNGEYEVDSFISNTDLQEQMEMEAAESMASGEGEFLIPVITNVTVLDGSVKAPKDEEYRMIIQHYVGSTPIPKEASIRDMQVLSYDAKARSFKTGNQVAVARVAYTGKVFNYGITSKLEMKQLLNGMDEYLASEPAAVTFSDSIGKVVIEGCMIFVDKKGQKVLESTKNGAKPKTETEKKSTSTDSDVSGTDATATDTNDKYALYHDPDALYDSKGNPLNPLSDEDKERQAYCCAYWTYKGVCSVLVSESASYNEIEAFISAIEGIVPEEKATETVVTETSTATSTATSTSTPTESIFKEGYKED